MAQDEGSAMAEYAWRRGWRTAGLATNTLLVYFKNVVTAFEKRFTQLGGRIVTRESYATGANNVNTAVSRLNGADADVFVTSTAFGELPALVGGLRSLDNRTPILNSWAGDGTYWLPQGQDIDEYYAVTYASVFGDDPNKAVKAMIAALTKAGAAPGTGGFVTGAAAIDGVVTAIKRAGGSTDGAALARQLERFKKVPALGGEVNFSARYHSVFGRQYRVIRIQDSKARYVGTVRAKVIPKI
jgi:branched-chain amino acid transport system substrate-binding protein